MTTTSFSCCKKTLFAFSAHYFTTAFLPRQPCFLNFSVSLQKVKVPDDIFRIIRHFLYFCSRQFSRCVRAAGRVFLRGPSAGGGPYCRRQLGGRWNGPSRVRGESYRHTGPSSLTAFLPYQTILLRLPQHPCCQTPPARRLPWRHPALQPAPSAGQHPQRTGLCGRPTPSRP